MEMDEYLVDFYNFTEKKWGLNENTEHIVIQHISNNYQNCAGTYYHVNYVPNYQKSEHMLSDSP